MTKTQKRFYAGVKREWKEYCSRDRKRLAANLPPIPTDAPAEAQDTPPADTGPIITAEGSWGSMTREQREAEGWYEYTPGKWRKWRPETPIDHGPACWTVDTYQSGRSRWQTHGKDDVGAPDVVEDYAHPDGERVCREMGHKYVRLPDGREGPAPFGSSWKEAYYAKYTAQRRKDRNEKHLSGQDRIERKRRELAVKAEMLGLHPERERQLARAMSFDPEGR